MKAIALAVIVISAQGLVSLDLASASPVAEKLNGYIDCTNSLSERAYESRSRYFSWAAKSGPTGKERIIYGTYTISEPDSCQKSIESANALEPHDAALEGAGSDYLKSVQALYPLLKEADDYYEQENYKDDKMAKGKALHPRLVAAWSDFEKADSKLRGSIDTLSDKIAVEELAEIEKSEGRKGRYHIQALMIKAKQVLRDENAEGAPDVAKITASLAVYEDAVKAAEQYAGANKDSGIGSSFIGSAKSFLVTSKGLMRRIRDKVPYSDGDKMMMDGGSGGWMVEGSPARQTRDYNDLIDSYNRGGRF